MSDNELPSYITQEDNGDEGGESAAQDKILPRPSPKPVEQMPTQTRPPANISQMALYKVLGNALINKAEGVFTPNTLQDVTITYSPPVDLEEMANGVVHPITKETVTKYAKIIKVLEL